LREFCSRLGHKAPCFGVSFSADLVELAEKKAQMLTTGQCEVLPEDARFLTAISEELLFKQTLSKVYLEDAPASFVAFSRYYWDLKQKKESVYPWLEGKSVLFCGVSATVVSHTKIKKIAGPQSPGMCDVAFYSGLDSWRQNYVSSFAYVPVNPQVVSKEFPDWRATSRKVMNFYEYVKVEEKKEPVFVSIEPVQIYKGNKYHPLSFFPYVDSSICSCPLRVRGKWEEGGQLFSVEMRNAVLHVIDFRPELWRSSLWIKGDVWQPLSQCVHLESFVGQMPTSLLLPWDMLPQEIEQRETLYDGGAQARLRHMWEEDRVVEDVFLRQQVKVLGRKHPIQMKDFVREQKEFDLVERRLIRRVSAHPAFSRGYVWDTWRKLRQNYMSYDQFKKLMQILDS